MNSDSSLCAIISAGHLISNKNTKPTKMAITRVSEATKHFAETQDPPSQDPGDHKMRRFTYHISAHRYGVNSDDAESLHSGELNPGAGPGPVALPEAFGANRRLHTAAAPAADPPRTYLVSIPPHPRSTIIVVIYSVFCVWCSKNIVFYRVLWPSPSPGFILAT